MFQFQCLTLSLLFLRHSDSPGSEANVSDETRPHSDAACNILPTTLSKLSCKPDAPWVIAGLEELKR